MPQKYEREIDEILRRMDTFLPAESLPRRLRRRGRAALDALGQRFAGRVSISPTNLMLAGLVLAFLGYLLRTFVPSVSAPISLVALAFFVGALALSISRSRRNPRMGWRGRSIEYSSRGLVWEGWLRRWQQWRRARKRGPRL
jgi:hypothetical protein